MNGHTAHIDHYKKPRAWHWRPVRVAGQNAIGVYCGRRLVRVFSAHEVDDAHALVTMRNLNKPELARCIGYAEITDSKL